MLDWPLRLGSGRISSTLHGRTGGRGWVWGQQQARALRLCPLCQLLREPVLEPGGGLGAPRRGPRALLPLCCVAGRQPWGVLFVLCRHPPPHPSPAPGHTSVLQNCPHALC